MFRIMISKIIIHFYISPKFISYNKEFFLRKNIIIVFRSQEWWNYVASSENDWIANFRGSKEIIMYICSKLKPIRDTQAISVEHRVAMT